MLSSIRILPVVRAARPVFRSLPCSFHLGRVSNAPTTNQSGQENAGKKLFTPGPLGTSATVKSAMLRDLGSRDTELIQTVRDIRKELLQIANVSEDQYTAVIMQGSGTYCVESVFQTTIPRDRTNTKVLVAENGAYGRRLGQILTAMGVSHTIISHEEAEMIDLERVDQVLTHEGPFSHVAVVHCETSSGVFNPIEEIGKRVKKRNPETLYFVDAMSSFGAVPVDIVAGNIDYLVSSANKCIEGVPGFSYAIARKEHLQTCKGNSHSMSLDMAAQYESLEANGQFRFTPPTHSFLAFRQALDEYWADGGLQGRAHRYKENRRIVREGMAKFGFKEFLEEDIAGYIITAYHYPKDDHFSFTEFYSRLNEKDQVIYPGKVLNADCFRIGNIGQLYPEDMRYLLECIEQVCQDMGMSLPVKN